MYILIFIEINKHDTIVSNEEKFSKSIMGIFSFYNFNHPKHL